MTKEKTKFEKFFSFNINEDELTNQIKNYNSLKINKSYRGIASLIIFTISAISLFAAVLMKDQIQSMDGAFFGILIYAVLGVFILKGKKWAILTAMVLWTSDKALFIVQMIQSGSGGIFIVFCFWLLVMRFFWRALEVENYKQELADLMNDSKK